MIGLGEAPADVTEAKPASCRHVGLDCKTCVSKCARNVAQVCEHLGADQQRSLFFKLYPDRICHSNVGAFQKSYEKQCRPAEPVEDEVFDLAELALA